MRARDVSKLLNQVLHCLLLTEESVVVLTLPRAVNEVDDTTTGSKLLRKYSLKETYASYSTAVFLTHRDV